MRRTAKRPGHLWLVLLALGLAACAQPQGRRTAPAGSVAVQPRFSGGAETVLEAGPGAATAKAEQALRARRTEANEVETRVTVLATPVPPGKTRLAIRALNLGTYVNSFTNTPQQSTCRSTGVLERELVEAVQAGP